MNFYFQDNELRRKQEERAAKLAEQAQKSGNKKRGFKTGHKNNKTLKNSADSDEECLVDKLMKEIRSGEFKLRRTVTSGQA